MSTSSSIVATTLHPENFARLKVDPNSTIICKEKTLILGDVTIGPGSVIHPTAEILAYNGPIVIGSNNLIEERVSIVNTNENKKPLIIGDHNVFEVDSHCGCPSIGNNNLFESKCNVSRNISMDNNCVIGAGCIISSKEKDHLKSSTIIFGRDCRRRLSTNLSTMSQSSQLDFLRKILPNYLKPWCRNPSMATPQR